MRNGFYGDPPTQALALDAVERMASVRLRVLCQEMQAKQVLKTQIPSTSSSGGGGDVTAERQQLDADQELDRNAHFVLRLAFCTYVRPMQLTAQFLLWFHHGWL